MIGILENGPGSIVLLRADMDALPHLKRINLEYTSREIAEDRQGSEMPVMHTCGHDMHTTSPMAVATLCHAVSTRWKGTLICLFQPDEETAGGEQAMVDDGLHDTKRYSGSIPQQLMPLKSTFLAKAVIYDVLTCASTPS